MLKHLDLFSGIGGFSLGLERTGGFETIAFCEIEPFCQKVLKKHWPDVPCYDDVRSLDYEGPVDVITGGYPCQPFSVAGNRKGEEDDRHLWPAMFSLITKHRPPWVIGENVAGHINMGLDDVLADLESEGYECRTFVIPACAVKAPHRRDRVWIIANTEQCGRPDCQKTDQERKRKPGTYTDTALSLRDASDSEGLHSNVSTDNREHSKCKVSESGNNTSEGVSANNRRQRGQGEFEEKIQGQQGFSWCKNVRRITDYFTMPDIPKPLIRRSSNGVSQRLHALGNAVVPQIVTILGHAILEAEK